MTYSREYRETMQQYVSSLVSSPDEKLIEEWKKLGYTDKQSEELARLSKLGDAGEIEAHVANRALYKTLKKYELEKENEVNRDENK